MTSLESKIQQQFGAMTIQILQLTTENEALRAQVEKLDREKELAERANG